MKPPAKDKPEQTISKLASQNQFDAHARDIKDDDTNHDDDIPHTSSDETARMIPNMYLILRLSLRQPL